MPLRLTTWNINSVRLRMGLVGRYVAEHAPDVLCLQETKCPDDQFPLSQVKDMGYAHWAFAGEKGYNGVAIFSRYALSDVDRRSFGGKTDKRYIGATIAVGEGLRVHNFYVPAGGDEPDALTNPKFAHKLAFLNDMERWSTPDAAQRRASVLVGDLNIAPCETDVWSHKALLKVVSHTPIETTSLESLRKAGGWTDAVRHVRPEPEHIYSWWSYRAADWEAANRGRRLDHIWTTGDLDGRITSVDVAKHVRGWDQPSDHVPVTVTIEV
jgi:exodeoxyribonuclease III